MRQGSNTVYYLLGDHLGSAAKACNAATSATTELRYPFSCVGCVASHRLVERSAIAGLCYNEINVSEWSERVDIRQTGLSGRLRVVSPF